MNKGEAAIEEERRCPYVALTRAKDKLKIYRNTKSLRSQFMDTGDEHQKDLEERSLYFLNGLPSELVEMDVSQQAFIQQERDLDDADPASFPDFDFD